jgi:DNA-binding response OmpR family regulator
MKILFVDDSEDYRILLKIWLNKTNYEYVIVKSVIEAQEILVNNVFDLIISDLLMPENSGIMMLEYLKKSKINTPIVIISVLREDEYPIPNYDIDNRFTKPTNCNGLEDIIHVVLSKIKLFEKK